MTNLTKRFLEPTNDLAFKKIFQDKERLRSFLNAVLNLSGDREIVGLEYLSQEQVPALPNQIKRSIMDVRCTAQCGTIFIVEMQNHAATEFLKRSQFYAAHTYVNQLSPKQTHVDLSPVILLAIANYEMFKDDPDYISYHSVVNQKTGVSHLKDISFVFIELEKFNKDIKDCITIQDEWIHMFKCAQDELEIPFSTPLIKEVYIQLEESRWTKDELDQYLKIKMYEVSLRQAEADKFEAGRAKGQKEGKKEGKKAGIKEGKKAGIKEGQQALIRTMHANGATVETISQLSGLLIVEVQAVLHVNKKTNERHH